MRRLLTTFWHEGGPRAKIGVASRPRPQPGEPAWIFPSSQRFGKTWPPAWPPSSTSATPGASPPCCWAPSSPRAAVPSPAGSAPPTSAVASPPTTTSWRPWAAAPTSSPACCSAAPWPCSPRTARCCSPWTTARRSVTAPTSRPTDQKFLYGHVWVTLAWVVRHPLWGALGLPLLARLYVRQKDLPRVPRRQGWSFHTKLELAAALVSWAAGWLRFAGRAVRAVADGFYAKRPFLKAAAAAGVTVVSRLRRDAGLRTLPAPPRGRRRRGRPPTYGPGRISLAKRAGQKRGWQVVRARQYGEVREKRVKTFLATWRPAGGVIRVVIVREEHGWLALFSTEPALTAEEILEIAADRFSIEQDFRDLKEVEGLGQQQVRDIWANVGAFHVSAWVHTLIELWAWGQPHEAICDRRDSPWDDPRRRPSHADRRKALQRR